MVEWPGLVVSPADGGSVAPVRVEAGRPSASLMSRARPRRVSLPRSLSTECSGAGRPLAILENPW